jgi:DNA-binding response OmpR family regulator
VEKRDFFSVMFGNLGFTVDTALDGCGALEKIRRAAPDLIMVSTVLPRLSGWELLARVKNDEALKMIPVVLLSDIADVKDKVNAFEQGAEEYISSPFSFPEVLARIRSLLRMRELFNQLSVRESRLLLAETLHAGLKESITLLLKNIDGLEEAVTQAQKDAIPEKTMPQIMNLIREKAESIRSDAVRLDAHVNNAAHEWNQLKSSEIAVSAFEQGAELG